MSRLAHAHEVLSDMSLKQSTRQTQENDISVTRFCAWNAFLSAYNIHTNYSRTKKESEITYNI